MRALLPILSPERSKRLRLATGFACPALALLWAAVSALRFSEKHPEEKVLSRYSSVGEILRHDIRARARWVSYRMPLASLSAARLEYHSSARYGVLLAANQLLIVLLIFAIGFLLHPYGGVIAALAVIALSRASRDLNLYPESGYYLLILLSAGLLVWRARAPSIGRTILLAAAVGATLLWRSPLAFFAPALALYEWAFEAPAKERWKQFAILCLVPYLFLLPWIAMNWTIHRRIVIFEKGAASAVLATGALGLVQNAHGDIRNIVGESVDTTNTGPVAGWAVREVLRHPGRFARAYFLRLEYALSFHPWLALFAAAGVWVFRKRREYRELALLAAYFLGIHCFMAVEERYFWPVYPLLALLACSLPAGLRAQDQPRAGDAEPGFSSAILKGALAAVMIFVLHAQWTVMAFASQARRGPGSLEAQLNASLGRDPDDAWLLGERGRARFKRGDFPGAAGDWSRAAALAPGSVDAQLHLARAEAMLGRPERLLAWSDAGSENLSLRSDVNILKACAYVQLGRKAQALEHLRLARENIRSQDDVLRGPQDPARAERERAVLDKLRVSDEEFAARSRGLQGPRPDAERRVMNEALAELMPEAGSVWLEKAELELRTGARRAARASAGRAESARLRIEDRRRLAGLYRGLGERGRAAAILEGLTRDQPEDPEAWLARAASEADAGAREAALASLARAEALSGDGEMLRRVALAYQGLKNYERAVEIFATLTRRYPGVAAFYSDKGLCEHFRGAGAAARADLRTAMRLDPSFLPAYLTLGAIYSGEGRFPEALKVYDEALKNSDHVVGDPLREGVLAARGEMLSKTSR